MSWHRVRKVRLNPEEKFHFAVADFLRSALPLDAYWTTIPTVGSSILQGAKLKRKGYRAGTPDIHITWRGMSYWLELKSPTGRLSNEQREAIPALGRAGACVGFCKTLEHVETWLADQWHIPLRATVRPEPAMLQAARRNPA